MREDSAKIVRTVCRKFRRREAGGAGHTFARVDVPTVGFRIAMLITQHAAVPPSFEEPARIDAVLTGAVAIEVVSALPGQNSCKMRRPHRCHEPLPSGVIRNP